MNEKSKLFVFSRLEVFLLFVFLLLSSATTFFLGVKMGKKYSFQAQGLEEQDKALVELYSNQEEKVQEIVKDGDQGVKKEEMEEASFQKLKEKISQEFSDENKKMLKAKDQATNKEASKQVEVKAKQENPPVSKDDKFAGKYTIQLGSYRVLKEAEEFAEGFRFRGYNPIINEVKIESKGVWFRVSLGIFETLSDAKDYIVKQSSLFQGQDYVIGKFD